MLSFCIKNIISGSKLVIKREHSSYCNTVSGFSCHSLSQTTIIRENKLHTNVSSCRYIQYMYMYGSYIYTLYMYVHVKYEDYDPQLAPE